MAQGEDAMGSQAAAGGPGWRRDGDRVVLIGQQCRQCGRRHFPQPRFCSGCHGRRFDPVELGDRGTLYSFSEIHVAPKAFRTPYIVGYVDFDAGVRVFGQVDGPLAGLRPDQRVEVVWGPIRTAPDGSVVEGYRFRGAEG